METGAFCVIQSLFERGRGPPRIEWSTDPAMVPRMDTFDTSKLPPDPPRPESIRPTSEVSGRRRRRHWGGRTSRPPILIGLDRY